MERERRAHPRKLVSTGVAFHDLNGAPLRGWLHDISRGGCFVATPSLFTFGEELSIDLTLPYPRQRVQGKARVVWVREKNDKDMPAGMGMELVDVSEDALVAIDKLAVGAKLSRPKTVIGLAPPAPGSSPSYSDVKLPDPIPDPIPEILPEIVPEAPAAKAAPARKRGPEKWLLGGAAAISVGGLVALGVVYARHGSTTAPALDAASASVTSGDSASVSASVEAPPPIVDAAAVVVSSAPDAGPRDAGADGGKKKKRTKKIRRR